MGRRPRGPGSPRGPGPPRSGPGLPPLLLVLALAAHGGCAAPAPRAEDLSLGVVSVRRGHGTLGTREPSSRALTRCKGDGRLPCSSLERCARRCVCGGGGVTHFQGRETEAGARAARGARLQV